MATEPIKLSVKKGAFSYKDDPAFEMEDDPSEGMDEWHDGVQHKYTAHQGDEGSMVVVSNSGYGYAYGDHTDNHGNPVLFHASPMWPTVHQVGTTYGGGHTLPTALGAAIEDTNRRYGVDPIPSMDLSDHSARMVQKLVGTGALEKGTWDESVNSYGRGDGHDWASISVLGAKTNPEYKELSPEDVASAQRTARQRLFPRRQGPLSSSQFTQEELF